MSICDRLLAKCYSNVFLLDLLVLLISYWSDCAMNLRKATDLLRGGEILAGDIHPQVFISLSL